MGAGVWGWEEGAVVLYLLKDQCPRRASSTRTRKSSRSTIHMPKNKSRDTAVPTEKEISSALEMVINWSCNVKACEGGATAEGRTGDSKGVSEVGQTVRETHRFEALWGKRVMVGFPGVRTCEQEMEAFASPGHRPS